jgi:hypothetical protein
MERDLDLTETSILLTCHEDDVVTSAQGTCPDGPGRLLLPYFHGLKKLD